MASVPANARNSSDIVPPNVQRRSVKNFEHSALWNCARPFVLAGLAGTTALLFTQPLDMAKSRMEQQRRSVGLVLDRSFMSVWRDIVHTDGFFALYRGTSGGVARQITYGATRLGIFRTFTDRYKARVGGKESDIPFLYALSMAVVAGTVGGLVGTPVDSALSRIRAASISPPAQASNYVNLYQSLWRMGKDEGMKSFFINRAGITVVRSVIFNAGMLPTYDRSKEFFMQMLGNGQTNRIVSGFVSGLCGVTLLMPLEGILHRLQTMKPDDGGRVPYLGISDCASKIIKTEGPFGLFSGYSTVCFRFIPHVILTWLFYENYEIKFSKHGW